MSFASGTALSPDLLREKLPAYLVQQRWFGGKARSIGAIEILDMIPISDDRISVEIVLATVHYADHYPDETYCVPLLGSHRAQASRGFVPDSSANPAAEGTLRDALAEPEFLALLLNAIGQGSTFQGSNGEVLARPTSALRQLDAQSLDELSPTLLKGEQSNSSAVFGGSFILKLLRQVREGINPELEIGTFLTERARGARVPALDGSIVYRGRNAAARTLGILQSFVPNQGNGWDYTLRALSDYLARVPEVEGLGRAPARGGDDSPGVADLPMQAAAQALFGPYLLAAELLGRRTAELHLALSSDSSDPDFSPEPFSMPYQLAFLRSMMDRCERVFELLGRQLNTLSGIARARSQDLLGLRKIVEQRLESFVEVSSDGARVRIHGDYHLGQVLCSDGDFIIIDFEGEPARDLAERRAKHSPLQDAAGMLRSFHYAAHKGLQSQLAQQRSLPDVTSDLEERVQFWRYWVSSGFLSAYLRTSRSGSFLPSSPDATAALLDVYLLNKAIYELEYELNNRPDWVIIPLEGILDILSR